MLPVEAHHPENRLIATGRSGTGKEGEDINTVGGRCAIRGDGVDGAGGERQYADGNPVFH